MRASLLRFLAQLCIVLAIATSMALLVDSLGVTPAYCSGKTGCHAAKLAARRLLGPVPLPLLGLLAFLGLLVATTLPTGRWTRRLEILGASVAALGGLGLLLVQAVILKTFCPFCVVVDCSAIVASGLLLAEHRLTKPAKSQQWLHPAAMVGLGVVGMVIPLAWPHFRGAAPLPPQLAEFARPGRVTVVEFVDLDCGHCRALYPVIEQLRAERSEQIAFTRLQAPLRSHRHAREAARVVQCIATDEQRAEKLTAALFENPRLDRASVLGAAEYVGMTEEQVEECWGDPSTEAALEANTQRLDSLGFQGLPTTYIEGERIVGAMPIQVYVAAVDRLMRSSGSARAEEATFCVLFAVLMFGIAFAGRRSINRPDAA